MLQTDVMLRTRPTLEELSEAVVNLVRAADPPDWGVLVFVDDSDGALHRFVVWHAFVIDNPYYDFKVDGVDCWDLVDLTKWRQAFPPDWSARRCKIRAEAEEVLAAALVPLEKSLFGDSYESAELIRNAFRKNTRKAHEPARKQGRSSS